jgi:hypothetical protein
MIAHVVGAATSPQKLLAALAAPRAPEVRIAGGRAWVALAHDTPGRAIDRLAKKLGGNLRVIAVEMPLGLRGEEMTAATFIAPGREDEDDLTDVASETLEEWLADMTGGFDEEVAARELAWALVDMMVRAMSEHG